MREKAEVDDPAVMLQGKTYQLLRLKMLACSDTYRDAELSLNSRGGCKLLRRPILSATRIGLLFVKKGQISD